jgi:hypothetical protein
MLTLPSGEQKSDGKCNFPSLFCLSTQIYLKISYLTSKYRLHNFLYIV